MRRSAAEYDAANGRAAAGARFAFAVLNAVIRSEVPWIAVRIAVVAQGASAVFNGTGQDFLNSAAQPRDLFTAQAVGGSARIDAGFEHRFVCVDVADSGDEALIQQGGLDGAPGF